MKIQIILLALTVVIGFTGIWAIFYFGFGIPYVKYETVYLNTANMHEAGHNIVDSTAGPSLINIFYYDKSNTLKSTVPWADVYVCVSYHAKDTTKIDTIIVLDTNTSFKNEHLKYSMDAYWTGLRAAKKLTACKVAIPANKISVFKKYQYKYAKVTLITDD